MKMEYYTCRTILSNDAAFTNKRGARRVDDFWHVAFASAPAKSISAKNHQDLYRSPLAMHFRGLHRTPDVIDLLQIGIRNHLARRPRLRLV